MTWVIVLLLATAIIITILLISNSKRTNEKHFERLKEEAKAAREKKASVPKRKKVENRPVSKPLKPKPKPKPPVQQPKPKIETPKKIEKTVTPQPKPEAKPVVKAEPKLEIKTEPVAIEKPPVELPKKEYPKYDNARAVEQLGLSQEEADMFISELIEQIDSEIPGLEAAINNEDIEKIESITHMIKGSATSLGSGGVADVLTDFNTYIKEDQDSQMIQYHLNNLKHHLVKLKAQFG